MSQSGILIFGREGGPTSKDNAYDTRKGRLQARLRSDPPHLAIIDNFPGGTALTASLADRVTETLYTIPHKLSYTPEAYVFFYVKTYNGSTIDIKAGSYNGNVLYYSGSTGTYVDKIYMEVDNKNLYIKHDIYQVFPIGSTTSDANKYLLRLKYYILSNNSHVADYSHGSVVG